MSVPTLHNLLRRGIVQALRLHHITGGQHQPTRGKKTFKKPLDPKHSDLLPEFEYVGVHSRPDKLLYTWGVSEHGGLGRASFLRPDIEKKQERLLYFHNPHRLSFGEFHKVVDVACGYGFTVFAVDDKKSSHTCYGTGINTDSQLGGHEPRRDHPLGMLISPTPIEVPLHASSNVAKVSCGRAHTIMLTDTGQVWSMGSNAYGQCGRPIIPSEDYGRRPVYHHLTSLQEIGVTQIECGQDTSFFLSGDGVVYSCGWGADGQTGRGHYNNEPLVGPVVGDLQGENIVKVSCKADCVLALNDKGEVFGWGNSEYQQLASVTDEMQINTARKMTLPGVAGKVVDIAAGGTVCLVLDEHGQVYSWGYGPIGKGPQVTHSREPTLIPSTLYGQNEITPDAKVVTIACGVNHFAAVNNHGSLFTWGKNPGGCLGQGHTNDQYFPLRVALGGQILKVSCGVDHTAVLVRELL